MSVSKRHDTSEPLTEHDVAERLDRAAMRTLRILLAARQLGIMDEVRGSRYQTNALNALADEMRTWGVEPVPLRKGTAESAGPEGYPVTPSAQDGEGLVTEHVLKTRTIAWPSLPLGPRRVEIRRDDRSYRAGDHLRLREWDYATESYTGRECVAVVRHVLYHTDLACGSGLVEGYAALTVEPLTNQVTEPVEGSP